jgi:hypothetical protein
MKAVGYGTKGSSISILDTCNSLSIREWLKIYLTSTYPKEFVRDVSLKKKPQEKFDKGKTQKASSPLDLIHSDIMGPFSHPSISVIYQI